MRSIGTCRQRARRLRLLLAMLLTGIALVGTAMAAPPTPGNPDNATMGETLNPFGPDANGNGRDARVATTPLPWNQLNAQQQAFLRPLQSQWDQLPPRRQQRMVGNVEHWSQLPPERQAQIQQRISHWAQMTPQQRQQAARNARRFQNMSPEDRQRVAEVFHRFQQLTPEQKQALREKFRRMRQQPDADGAGVSHDHPH